MENKKKIAFENNVNELRSIIKAWNISQPKIAETICMPLGTFKTKMSENQTAYKFTEQEFEAVIGAIYLLAADIQSVFKKHQKFKNSNIYTSKK